MEKNDFIHMEPKQLKAILAQEQEELRKLRFKAGQHQLKDIRKIRSTKKNIATLLTILNTSSL